MKPIMDTPIAELDGADAVAVLETVRAALRLPATTTGAELLAKVNDIRTRRIRLTARDIAWCRKHGRDPMALEQERRRIAEGV